MFFPYTFYHHQNYKGGKKESFSRGYISLVIIAVVLLAALLAGGISTSDDNQAFVTGHLALITPGASSLNTLQLNSLPLISDTPTPTPVITYPAGSPPPIPSFTPGPTSPPGILNGLKVNGNQLVDKITGAIVHLHGVNRSGTEFNCIQGSGIFDGPSDTASIQAIASWHANVIRIPLNEDCWLGINGAGNGGTSYQNAIKAYVTTINQVGLYVILDLHWSAPGNSKALGQQVMADSDHSIDFWKGVAGTFNGNDTVIFDLYNEPHDISWSCWKNGGTNCGQSWSVAGMQQLVDAVRSTGATNVLMLGGLGWASDLSQWATYKPNDSNIAASWHIYDNLSGCTSQPCWDSTAGQLAKSTPIITGEFNEKNSKSIGASFFNTFCTWMDANGISYTAWTWNTWGDWQSLINDYAGTPTSYDGQYYKNYLLSHW